MLWTAATMPAFVVANFVPKDRVEAVCAAVGAPSCAFDQATRQAQPQAASAPTGPRAPLRVELDSGPSPRERALLADLARTESVGERVGALVRSGDCAAAVDFALAHGVLELADTTAQFCRRETAEVASGGPDPDRRDHRSIRPSKAASATA